MKTPVFTLLVFLCATAATLAQSKVMYFESKTADSSHSVALWVEGAGVGGTQSSGPNEGQWKVVRSTLAQPDGTFLYDEDTGGEARWTTKPSRTDGAVYFGPS